MILLIDPNGVMNPLATEMVKQLQATNLLVTADNSGNCDFLVNSVEAWIDSFASRNKELICSDANFLASLAIGPVRCVDEFKASDFNAGKAAPYYFNIWDCESLEQMSTQKVDCSAGEYMVFSLTNATDMESMADALELRIGALQTTSSDTVVQSLELEDGSTSDTVYQVAATFNETFSIQTA
jgi:hypothetical protein